MAVQNGSAESGSPTAKDDDLEDMSLLGTQARSGGTSTGYTNDGKGIRGWFYRKAGFAPIPESPHFQRPTDGKWCPEEKAGFISQLLFLYMNSLMALGAKKHLEPDDLWDVASQNQAVHVTGKFEANMRETACAKTPYGSVWRSTLRTFIKPFAAAGLLKLLHDAVYLASPFVLRQLLLHLEQPNPSRAAGVGWALLLFCTGVNVPLIINQYFHRLFRISLHAKTALIHTLYRKALRISLASKASLGSGAIANLQSNDAAKVYNLAQYGHILWSAPLQLTVIILSLHVIVGWLPALAAFVVTLALVPINTVIGKYQAKYRKLLIKATDKRVKAVSEVIMGIKAIKLYAWEEPYTDTIRNARREEQRLILTSQLLGCISTVIFLNGPILVAIAAFSTYVWLGKPMTAAVAFPALAYFDLMRMPIIMLPNQIMNIINARVALQRMQKFVDAEELVSSAQLVAASVELQEDALKISDGSFAWDNGQNALPILHSINLKVPAGTLVMVTGEVGSGKSSLIAAILSEMHRIKGSVVVRGSIAYTSQDPWIQNCTVQDNILMGLPMNEARYNSVLHACALEDDLNMLAAGDQTEIGEKGVNLSGGQKHRIALARACYADADVYLLDDPLSAVDATVGRHLFEICVSQLLAKKTRILVTHQLQFLEHADLIVMMHQGTITAVGTYRELLSRGISFADAGMHDDEEEGKDAGADGDALDAEAANGKTSVGAAALKPTASLKRTATRGQLAGQEDRSKGSVDKNVYLEYLKAWGPALVAPFFYFSIALGERGLQMTQNYWLSVWSNKTATVGAEAVNTVYYLSVYFSLGFASILFQASRATTLVFSTIRASSTMHDNLLHKVMHLPMSFFDTQPSGRLLNRFTKDVENCDLNLQQTLSSVVTCSTAVLFSFFIVVAVTRGAILLVAVPLFFLYRFVQQYYLATSREIKRLDSVALSPIFSHFNETLNGLLTVRAFRRQSLFAEKNENLMDRSNRAYWPLMVGNRWLSIRLEGMGQTLMLTTAIFVALFVRNGGLAGFALTAATNLISLLTWATRQSTELEMAMNSVERLIEYNKYESEAPAVIEDNRPPPAWPTEGSIEVRELCVAYRPELPPVLKRISFRVNSHEKIGVCGRTGCGKSTLMMALYRIVEPLAGSIKIDGIEVTTIGLFDLRSKLSLVPQDPVIFTGTVRSNLDPFGAAGSDWDLWEAIRQSGLETAVKNMDGGLDAPLSEGGTNLSVGQRQLLCMARALLRKCTILLMDEATSNVDHDTDSIIQATIRSAFKHCTVLTIAHRLHTIVDSDRILMLDKGEILEFGPPQELLAKEGGGFQGLVKDARAGKAGLKATKSTAALLEATQ